MEIVLELTTDIYCAEQYVKIPRLRERERYNIDML